MAAQKGQVAPQGHTASRRQSQGQLRHTQKTAGHTLCPGQSWPMEHPPGGREGVPTQPRGLGESVCWHVDPALLITTGGCCHPACAQEGDRQASEKHSGCSQLPVLGEPWLPHPHLLLHCRCTQTGSGHQPPSRMPGT